MLYSYKECLEIYGNAYQIKKAVQNKKLYMKEKGIYSDTPYSSDLDTILMKFPNTIVTLNSAFYYYGFTDTIPDYYYLATKRNNRQITDTRVIQIFDNADAFCLGKTDIDYNGIKVPIYDKERLLIELIRNKRKFSFDQYKELISNYRDIIHEINISKVYDYACELPKQSLVIRSLQMEIL